MGLLSIQRFQISPFLYLFILVWVISNADSNIQISQNRIIKDGYRICVLYHLIFQNQTGGTCLRNGRCRSRFTSPERINQHFFKGAVVKYKIKITNKMDFPISKHGSRFALSISSPNCRCIKMSKKYDKKSETQ